MERPAINENSPAWMACVWISFALSVSMTLTGVYWMPVDIWVKGFMFMGVMFSVGSSLSLAKTIRDSHEGRKLINRVSEAKAERILHDFELKDAARHAA